MQSASSSLTACVKTLPAFFRSRKFGEMSMPQLWMTYGELGELFYGNAVAAPDHVINNQWERRRCSDGVTRAVVPPNAMLEFMLANIARQQGQSDCAVIEAHH